MARRFTSFVETRRPRFALRGRCRACLAAALGIWACLAAVSQAAPPERPGGVLPGPADAAPAQRPPRPPADFRSQHFLLHTDLPPAEARRLLGRLEVMLGLISQYWGQPLADTIECYVVRDLDAWPEGALDPAGREKIRQRAGITHVETLNRGRRVLDAKAVVYAVADRGTPQHEAVHAYCGQTFGRMGPLWYAEGMAELGQYWRKGDASVRCPGYVIEYLRNSRPKPLRRVLAEDSAQPRGAAPVRTGDSWQNYSWRWALCHLLAHNPNYSDRFRPLGLGYLTGAPVSFAETYGAVLDELEFEYRFFVRHVQRGFRADLCRWNWQRKFRQPDAGAVAARVAAKRGWQPSGALVRRGEKYAYTTSGVWHIAPDRRDVTADGLDDGSGRLEGVVFRDFTLGEPFALSAYGTFTAPADGRLYLRCREAWNELHDNLGSVAVEISRFGRPNDPARPAPAQIALPGPADAP